MAFWAGVAAGVEARQKERIAEEETAYRRQRDEEADAYRDKVFEYNRQRDSDALQFQNKKLLLDAMPSSLIAHLSGTSPYGSSVSKKGLTADAIATGAKTFDFELKSYKDKNVDFKEDSDLGVFFNTVSKDNGAKATLMAFIQAQVKQGNTVSMSDLPNYFKVAGTKEGTDPSDVKKLLADITSGSSEIKDYDSLFKGLVAIKTFLPTQVFLTQKSTILSVEQQTQEYKAVISQLSNAAVYNNLSGAQNMLKNSNAAVQQEGIKRVIQQLPDIARNIFNQYSPNNKQINMLTAMLPKVPTTEVPTTEENTPEVLSKNERKIHDENVKNGLVYNSKKELEDALSNLDSGLKVYYRSEDGVFRPFRVPPKENTTETIPVKYSKGGLADDMDTEPMEETTEMRPVDQAQEQFSEFGLKMPTNDKELEAYKQTLVTVKELINPNMDTSVLKELTDRAIQNVEAIRNG